MSFAMHDHAAHVLLCIAIVHMAALKWHNKDRENDVQKRDKNVQVDNVLLELAVPDTIYVIVFYHE